MGLVEGDREMTVKLSPIADKLARKIKDNRSQPEWEQELLEDIDWATGQELDFKTRDILFDMIVRRWDRARDADANTSRAISRLMISSGAVTPISFT